MRPWAADEQSARYLVCIVLLGDGDLVRKVCVAAASLMMYITLVYLTGAFPAEYYSAKKRSDYKRYQETTNRFFPGFPNQ